MNNTHTISFSFEVGDSSLSSVDSPLSSVDSPNASDNSTAISGGSNFPLPVILALRLGYFFAKKITISPAKSPPKKNKTLSNTVECFFAFFFIVVPCKCA